MRNLTLVLILLCSFGTVCFSETASFIPAANTTVDCVGVVATTPPAKSHKITMTNFKQKTVYYTEELKKGNEVIIVNYNGSNYQVIKL